MEICHLLVNGVLGRCTSVFSMMNYYPRWGNWVAADVKIEARKFATITKCLMSLREITVLLVGGLKNGKEYIS